MSFVSQSFTSGTGTATTSTFVAPTDGQEPEESPSIVYERINAFPFRPAADPGSLTDFVEETGTNRMLIEALQKLYAVPNKPENPIEWLRLYFKFQFANSDSGNSELEEIEALLKAELAELEAEILDSFEVEVQNKAIIEKLEHEVKNIKMKYSKSHHHDEFRKYKHHPDNYHYRIRPTPSYQPSKTDMMIGIEEEAMSNVKREDSLVEIVPFDPATFYMEPEPIKSKVSYDKLYEDYPATYFPEFVSKPHTALEQEEDTAESGEVSEGVEETEYDAGSEGESEDTRIIVEPMSQPGGPPSVKKGRKSTLLGR